MAARRKHKRGYKFTEKTQSKRGMLALFFAVVSLAIFITVVVYSFQSRGNGSVYLGSAGVASMILSVIALGMAVASLREENSFKLFPYLSTVVSFLTAGIWIALYAVGFAL